MLTGFFTATNAAEESLDGSIVLAMLALSLGMVLVFLRGLELIIVFK